MTAGTRAKETLALGVVGPGGIADVFAAAVTEAGVARIARVLGRTPASTTAFAARYGARRVGGFDALLDRNGPDAIEAVYVATPHASHAFAVRAALEAGVPVLCEKPLTTDPGVTESLFRLAEERGVALMEAWMYRAHPQMAELLACVGSGALGAIRRVEAEFSFSVPFDPAHRLFAPELGGGAVLDVGGYPLSFALAVARAAGHADTAALAEAPFVSVQGSRTPSGVDGDARAILDLGGIEADLVVSIHAEGLGDVVRSRARVVGAKGSVWLEEPWCPEGERRGRVGVLHTSLGGREERREVPSAHDSFALEALAFTELVRGDRPRGEVARFPRWPLVDPAESVAVARLAARLRAAILSLEPAS